LKDLRKTQVKVPEYHQSALDTFLRCGRQFEFRYILNYRSPYSGASMLGTSVHAAVNRNLIAKKENKVGCSLEEALDTFSSDFDIRAQETEFKEDESKDALKDVGAELVQLHHTKIAPDLIPDKVEEHFIIETDAGYNLAGKLDLITADGVIHDLKTSKAKYADNAVTGALQPAMYDFAYEALRGEKAKGFQYDVLMKPTKTIGARYQQVRGEVTEQDRNWLFETVDTVHRAIGAGVFLPAQEDSWVCSPKWCSYWSMCKGKKE
jgi:hypothetical protein